MGDCLGVSTKNIAVRGIMIQRIHYVYNNNYSYKAMSFAEYDIVCLAVRTNLPNMDADDIAQELRFRLFSQLHHFNPYKASFRTWMLEVLKNHLINLHRDLSLTDKRKANLNLSSLESWLDIDKHTHDIDIMLAIRKLPNLEKAVIFCLFIKNMALRDTANKLKCTQRRIKEIKESAKLRLKQFLN